jgi:Spy/CpxP family protein refolding chaperone
MKARFAIVLTTALGAILFIATVVAQQPAPVPGQQPPQPTNPPNQPHPANPDPLAHLMFPPDMILGHARELNLTDEQKAFMRGEVQRTTATFQELQWKLQDQMELLHETMKSTTVNEQQALAQLDKVLEIEREIKRLHIGLAVRIKNRLTPEQQQQLHKMRMDHHMRMSPEPGSPIHPIE